MADYTDTLTYSVALSDGTVYSDTITQTISSATEALHYTVKIGTAGVWGSADTILRLESSPNSPFSIDGNYFLFINRDDQILEILMGNIYYRIPPNGFFKLTVDGSGSYEVETQASSTQSAWVDITEIQARFLYNEGIIEVIAIQV